jgi:SAM-dependent methyltransferase
MKFAALLIGCCALVFGQASEYNSIYRGENGDVFSRQPNAFVVEMTKGRKPGKALDAGMGQGRNSIYLAKQGWDVTGFDSADEGVRQAKAEASRLGLRITASVDMFEQFDFGENQWDLIVLTYEPVKQIASKVEKALRPGGLVVVEDRHLDTRRVWPAGTFGDNELLALFRSLRVLRYEDLWARPDWSARGIDERLVRLAAEKALPRAAGCLWEGKLIPEGGTVCWEVVTFRCGADGWKFTREKCGGP